MTRYLLIALVACVVALMVSVRSCTEIKADRERLSDNQRTLLTDVDFYRTKDSLSAAGVERLTLSNREFSRYCGELQRTVADLNVKVKRLQSVSQTVTETKYVVNTVVRDSITPGDTLKCVDYRDAYLTFSGCAGRDAFSGTIESRDTLVQVVHRIPRRFWFLRWGTKAIRQEVTSRNPHSQIVFTEYIELKR